MIHHYIYDRFHDTKVFKQPDQQIMADSQQNTVVNLVLIWYVSRQGQIPCFVLHVCEVFLSF